MSEQVAIPVSAPAVDRPRSPLSPAGCRDLYLRPSAFFTSPRLTSKPELFIAVWLVGIVTVIDRLDERLIAAEFGFESGPWLSLAHAPWPLFWAVVLLVAVVHGGLAWLLGGWWYRVRLELSGADRPDPRRARIVYTYQQLVEAVPSILAAIVYSLVFLDYAAASESEEVWSLTLVVFVVWSCFTSYFGATAAFKLSRVRAAIWFIAAPLVFYTVLVLGLALAMVIRQA